MGQSASLNRPVPAAAWLLSSRFSNKGTMFYPCRLAAVHLTAPPPAPRLVGRRLQTTPSSTACGRLSPASRQRSRASSSSSSPPAAARRCWASGAARLAVWLREGVDLPCQQCRTAVLLLVYDEVPAVHACQFIA